MTNHPIPFSSHMISTIIAWYFATSHLTEEA
jgi:hypothetical protein